MSVIQRVIMAGWVVYFEGILFPMGDFFCFFFRFLAISDSNDKAPKSTSIFQCYELHSRKLFLRKIIVLVDFTMVMRVKRTIDIAMSNYKEIIGFSVFTYEGRVAYASENMEISGEIDTIVQAWNGQFQNFTLKSVSFLTALKTKQGFVAINPEGAVSLICGTGKGVWFVSVFAPMDVDKDGILRECVQSAKNLESSVSIFDV